MKENKNFHRFLIFQKLLTIAFKLNCDPLQNHETSFHRKIYFTDEITYASYMTVMANPWPIYCLEAHRLQIVHVTVIKLKKPICFTKFCFVVFHYL